MYFNKKFGCKNTLYPVFKATIKEDFNTRAFQKKELSSSYRSSIKKIV